MNFKDNNQVCVFVSSSDNTKDVFNQVSKSIIANWNDIPYKLYVGVNSYSKNINDKFTQITSNIKGWRYELLNQVNQLPNNINYLILFLDDFLILSDVQTSKIIKIVDQAIKEKIDYLGFIPCRLGSTYKNWLLSEVEVWSLSEVEVLSERYTELSLY